MVHRPTVVLLTTNFDIGGAERVYAYLARGLRDLGYRVIAACLQIRSGSLRQHLGPGIEVVDMGMASKMDVRAAFRLFRLLRSERPSVLYTFMFHPHLVGRIVGRLARVPIILSSQQTMAWEGPVQEALNRLTARWCAAVVAVSKRVEEYLATQVGVPREKLVTVYNCVDLSRFGSAKQNGDPRSDFRQACVVGSAARLNPEKDHDTLIQAIHLVRKRFPEVRLLLAGDGPERERLHARVQTFGLAGQVKFLGHVEDIARFYPQLDLYVQSSHVEGFPCSVLEALACRLPVIATRVGGTEEAVVDGECGLLVPPRDATALARALEWMIENPQKAREMGERGRLRVLDLFSAEAMVRSTDGLIQRLLEHRNQKERPSAS